MNFPPVLDPAMVGEYPAQSKAGGGFVWDAVLEYRVWCHPELGAEDEGDGSDYYYAFDSFEKAEAFSRNTDGAEEPLALVLQREYISENEPGKYVHVREERVTEWPVAFLARPQRDEFTIPDFMADDAPANRLEILRGLAPRPARRNQASAKLMYALEITCFNMQPVVHRLSLSDADEVSTFVRTGIRAPRRAPGTLRL